MVSLRPRPRADRLRTLIDAARSAAARAAASTAKLKLAGA
jgi:hypothetical protein